MPKQPDRDNVDALFGRALESHQAGRLREAESTYKQVLTLDGNHVNSLTCLGTIHLQEGHTEEGIRLIGKSLEIYPAQPHAHNNLGNAFRDLKRLDEALASYERAIVLQPDYAEAHYNRGNTLQDLNRLNEALASYDRAIVLRPDYAEAYYFRGYTLQSLNCLDEALASYDRVLALRPEYAEAHYNRGIALQLLNRVDDALRSYDHVIGLRPDFAEAHYNRGELLKNLKRLDEALASYERALALRPDYAEAFYSRGIALQYQSRLDEALASYERALALRPEIPFLLGDWLHCKMHSCNWQALDEAFSRVGHAIDAGEKAATPFTLLAMPATAAQQQRCARTCIQDRFPDVPAARHVRSNHPAHDRFRIGYFSSDFDDHPVSQLTARLIETHDRSRFEIIGFSFGPPAKDAWRQRLEKAFDRLIDVERRTDSEIASLARELEIDVAVDLNGHTQDARTGIFGFHPAPVQVNYLGYPGTMGADYFDYLIADPTLIPPEDRHYYDEKIVCLPHSYQANDATKAISDRHYSRAELGLPEDAFVFCCFNNYYKLTPDLLDIWMRLLHSVSGSVLWLSTGNTTAARNLRQEVAKRGIAPERLVFAPRLQTLAEHLARHRQADLFLDTFYFNAHTTASDALWAGLPVLTCPGKTFTGRVAASLLRAVGLPGLIAADHAHYESLALELATQPDKLAAFRQKLARHRNTHPLFDTSLFARHLEEAYKKMIERQRAGLPPGHITVESLPPAATD